MVKTYVLIHGGYHGAWCWYKVKKLLEQKGCRVIAPDLPEQPVKGEITLDDYVLPVVNEIKKLDCPVYLVGHSLGGHIITAVSEIIPENIKCAVYVTATLLESGKKASDMVREPSEMPRFPVKMQDGRFKWYLTDTEENKKKVIDYFYNDCSMEDIEYAFSRIKPQAIKPVETPVFYTPKNFGNVKKVYIECTGDQNNFPSVQQRMYSKVKCSRVYKIDSGHSPFFSKPEELAGILLDIGK